MREVSDHIQFVQVVIVILMLWIINLAKKPQLPYHPLYRPPLTRPPTTPPPTTQPPTTTRKTTTNYTTTN